MVLNQLFFVLLISSTLATKVMADTFPISHLKQKGTQIVGAIESLTPENCSNHLKLIYEEIIFTQPVQYDKNELILHSKELIENSFDMRQEIRKKVKEFNLNHQYSFECNDAVKRSLKSLRAFEDYLGHLVVTNNYSLSLKEELTNHFELKSGDIILSRGDQFTSSTIARMGDEQQQFSHASLVYIDENNKIFTIEAHMEKGTVIIPIEEYFKDGKLRATLYRQPNEKLAHEAAKHMYELAKKGMDVGHPIPYDMQMNWSDPSRLFCSEVIQVGYDYASKGEYSVPLYKTHFTMKNRDLFDRIGSTATEAFLPSDLDSDPRFDLIMEWTDFSRINIAWTYDAITVKLFEWMQNDDYRLKNTFEINLIKNLAFYARRAPLIKNKLEDKMTLDMTKEMIAGTASFYFAIHYFEKKLKKLDENALAHTGYPLTIAQQFAAIETIKALKPKFSKTFHKK